MRLLFTVYEMHISVRSLLFNIKTVIVTLYYYVLLKCCIVVWRTLALASSSLYANRMPRERL